MVKELLWSDALMKSRLFAGIAMEEISPLLDYLHAKRSQYLKGEVIFLAGNPADRVGVVLRGEAQVVRDDVFGNRSILTELGAADLFGETFACAKIDRLPVSVEATTDCEVLLLDYRRIVLDSAIPTAFHSRLVENMLGILADKNLTLNRKIEVLSARTTRDKLLAYLSAQARQSGNARFEIPFDRQELADYLAVERSAMSAELSRMRRDSLVEYHKNQFHLLLRD